MTERPERITTRPVATGDDAALAAMLGGDLRVGLFQGVAIDFRHPQLPIGEWEAMPWWYVWGDPPNNAGLIFPAEARFGIEALRESKALPADFPAVYALPNDKVVIERVEIVDSGKLFDHPHDREVRLAYLTVTRPTGEVLRPSGPLAFYGKGRIIGGAGRESFDHIVERVLRLAGVEGFPPRPIKFHATPPSPLDRAVAAAAEAHGDYFKLHQRLDCDAMAQAYLRSLANSAALMGFLLAKLEAHKAERAGSGAMKNREKGTAKVTRIDWLTRAEGIWAEHPEYRRTYVAKLIAEGTDDDPRAIMRAIKSLDPHLKD